MQKNLIKSACLFIIVIFVLLILIPAHISLTARGNIFTKTNNIPEAYVAMVPGAMVYSSGRPSIILKDRLMRAIKLYRKGKVKKILASGDHGTRYYDEVNNMKKFLLKNGVRAKDLFLDHAGFNTYNSVARAKEIFMITRLIIVTQEYHLPRALYIANKKGLSAFGFTADLRKYKQERYNNIREHFAKVKSFFEVLFNIKPDYLGKRIPITGNSKLSWD